MEPVSMVHYLTLGHRTRTRSANCAAAVVSSPRTMPWFAASWPNSPASGPRSGTATWSCRGMGWGAQR